MKPRHVHQVCGRHRKQQPLSGLALDGRKPSARRWFACLSLLLALALLPRPAAAQDSAPPSVRIAVIGDYGDGSRTEGEVAALVASWQPDIVVTTGDNNYPDGAAETIDRNIGQFYSQFIAPYGGAFGPGAETNRFFPTLGNHDWHTTTGTPPLPTPYLDYFTLPPGPGQERYYDVIWGPVHIFALDSDWREPDGITANSAQARWLQQGLAESSAPWKLVVMHEPPFSSGYHGSNKALQWPFEEWGATAVLAGHDHTYERIVRDGFPYFVNGVSGRDRYWFILPVAGSQVRFNADSGAMLVEADERTIRFAFITRAGDEIDRYTITAGSSASATLPAATPSPIPTLPSTHPLLRPSQRPVIGG